MFQNRFERRNEVEEILLELFGRGAIRSTGDELIEIVVGHDSVALSINRENFEQTIQEIVERTTTTTGGDVNARMATLISFLIPLLSLGV